MTERSDSRQWSLARIQAVFRAVFDDESMEVSEATSLGTIAGWDQARHLDLLAAIEKKFGVRFTTNEVSETAAASGTVGTLAEALSRKLEGIRTEEQAPGRTDESENTDFGRQWTRTAMEDRPGVLSAHIREQLSHVLGFENPGDIDAREGFINMGMDSITTFLFMKRLVQSIGHAFPVTLAFEHPNVEALCRYLLENVLGSEPPVPSEGDFSARAPSAEAKEPAVPLVPSGDLDTAQAQKLLAHLDQLTDDEVEQVLASISSRKGD